MVNKRVRNAVLGCNLKNDRMISVRFQGKPFNITVIQVYAPTSNTEEAGSLRNGGDAGAQLSSQEGEAMLIAFDIAARPEIPGELKGVILRSSNLKQPAITSRGRCTLSSWPHSLAACASFLPTPSSGCTKKLHSPESPEAAYGG